MMITEIFVHYPCGITQKVPVDTKYVLRGLTRNHQRPDIIEIYGEHFTQEDKDRILYEAVPAVDRVNGKVLVNGEDYSGVLY